MKDKKVPIFYESRFWFDLYAVVMWLLITVQLTVGFLAVKDVTFHSVNLNRIVNGSIDIPMEVAAWFWLAIIIVYVGMDRVVDIRNSMSLPVGEVSMGELPKLRSIMVISLVLFIYCIVSNFLVDKDFQLVQMFSAFATSVILYIGGNKAVKSFKYYSNNKDNNKDGVPDEIEEEYYRWERQQRKNGVEARFINVDYFLDENPDVRERLKKKKNG